MTVKPVTLDCCYNCGTMLPCYQCYQLLTKESCIISFWKCFAIGTKRSRAACIILYKSDGTISFKIHRCSLNYKQIFLFILLSKKWGTLEESWQCAFFSHVFSFSHIDPWITEKNLLAVLVSTFPSSTLYYFRTSYFHSFIHSIIKYKVFYWKVWNINKDK